MRPCRVDPPADLVERVCNKRAGSAGLTDMPPASHSLKLRSAAVAALTWWAAPISAQTTTNPRPLRAEPGWLCQGDEFTIRWSGASPARLETTKQAFDVRDGLRLAASDSGILRALAPNGTLIAAETLSFHPDRMEHNFVRPTAACAGRLSVASMAIAPSRASDRIRPILVTNRSPHTVLIVHRGRSVRVRPGASTTELNDVPFSGDWGVVVETTYNTWCPVPADTTPVEPKVDLLIVTSCATRGPT
jgi:hypothetical protein